MPNPFTQVAIAVAIVTIFTMLHILVQYISQ